MFDRTGWTYICGFGSAKVYGRGDERAIVDKRGYETHRYTFKVTPGLTEG